MGRRPNVISSQAEKAYVGEVETGGVSLIDQDVIYLLMRGIGDGWGILRYDFSFL